MEAKHYPVDERGQLDAGLDSLTRWPKPCCRRIDRGSMVDIEGRARVMWCTQPEGHEGQCSSPLPPVLAPSSYAATRLRGLRQDLFADRFEQCSKGKP